jgi:hypothetical protein
MTPANAPNLAGLLFMWCAPRRLAAPPMPGAARPPGARTRAKEALLSLSSSAGLSS